MDNPWHRLPDRPPFVLPEDEVVVREFNSTAPDEAYKFRIDELMPEPFVGDPQAPVVLLSNNPGFTPQGATRKKEPRFTARMRANLLHEPTDYPFVFFAPDINAGHRTWWDKKLKALLGFGHDNLARVLLTVEHCPYPSQRYRSPKSALPSREYNLDLVRRAMARNALIILVRGQHRWTKALPELENYSGLCTLRNPQAGTISPKNCERFSQIEAKIKEELALLASKIK